MVVHQIQFPQKWVKNVQFDIGLGNLVMFKYKRDAQVVLSQTIDDIIERLEDLGWEIECFKTFDAEGWLERAYICQKNNPLSSQIHIVGLVSSQEVVEQFYKRK